MTLKMRKRAYGRTPIPAQAPAPLPAEDDADDLPPHVKSDIDAAMVHERSTDPKQPSRVVVQLPESRGWFDGMDETPKAIAARYPELSPSQVDVATRWLRSVVRQRIRERRRLARGTGWVHSW
jgi:hypothetical protein